MKIKKSGSGPRRYGKPGEKKGVLSALRLVGKKRNKPVGKRVFTASGYVGEGPADSGTEALNIDRATLGAAPGQGAQTAAGSVPVGAYNVNEETPSGAHRAGAAQSPDGDTDKDKGGARGLDRPRAAAAKKPSQGDEGRRSKEGGRPGRYTEQQLLADAPTLPQLEKELGRSQYRRNFARVLRDTLVSLVVVAAVSALVAVLFLPVLQIHSSSMAPTLQDKDIVVSVGVGRCNPGDLIAFHYNNNILVKRVIAVSGDWVEIDGDGNVSVNGEQIDEPYISEKALGDCDISFPYQVPDGQYFVMGDHRETSIDSRNTIVGCVSGDMVIGRILVRVWPFETFAFF